MASRILIQRMKVTTANALVAYDEYFHKGINIIRGENSSGKSTVTHLLFFGLGGDYSDFVPEVRNCKYVFVQLEINNCVLTLRREIIVSEEGKVNGKAGITIYWGNIDEAENGMAESHFFGYNMSDKRKSFSNALFGLMDMPLVVGDSNITMHQLLRLLYIDQESPTGSLFMFEVFDSQITRETVADLLMGIYDSDLYILKINVREWQKQFDDVKSEIKAVRAALNRPEEQSVQFLESVIESKKTEIINISEVISKKRAGVNIRIKHVNNLDSLKDQISNLRVSYENLCTRVDQIKSEIEDTNLFIEALEKRQKALSDSMSVRKSLEFLTLDFCPECLTKLDNNVEEGHCRLCKAPIDNTRGIRQAKRYEMEISFQIKESKIVLNQLMADVVKEKSSRDSIKSQLNTLETLLAQELKNVRSPQDEEIDDLIYTKGLIEGEILQYRTMIERASYLEGLITRQQTLENQIHKAIAYIKAKESQQAKNKNVVESKIKEFGVYLLQNDLDRQKEFTSADEFFVDFSNNIVYLSNKHSKYSASSNFYLKIVARFALFLASLEIPFMRFPHFIFADNMEDKGIEIERAQNFQNILINKLKDYSDNDYQVIYTTSYITDELDHSAYVVGERYTKDNKSLKNIDASF